MCIFVCFVQYTKCKQIDNLLRLVRFECKMFSTSDIYMKLTYKFVLTK